MANSENSMAWLEAALGENLRPVGAPAGLWDRVQLPNVDAKRFERGSSVSSVPWRLTLASAVAAMLVLGLLGFGRASREFRSSDPMAIRAWVQDRCGFALPLSAKASPEIRLSEVRLKDARSKKDSTGATELAFAVENRPALLRITRAETVSATEMVHGGLAAGATSASWVADGKLFTLACATPQDLRIACSLCHAGGDL